MIIIEKRNPLIPKNKKMDWIKNIKNIFSIKKAFVETSWNWIDDWLFVDLFNEYSSRDLHKLSKTDYLNFYKWRCFVAVWTIAQAVSQLDRQVTDGKWKPINDPLLDLISDEFLLNVVSYMKLNGWVYIWKNMVWNKVVNLHILRPDLVHAILNDTKTAIDHYDYNYSPNKKKRFEVDEIISIQNFNPLYPYPLNIDWLSDVQAIATAIDADYQASKWNWKFFYNNASVDGVLETEQNLSPENVEKIQNKRDQKYRWTDNAHKIWILTGGLKYRAVNPSQKEMDFVESRRFNRDEILWFFKVPKAMIGLWEWNGNNLNVRAYEQIFARQVVKPLAKRIARSLNYELFGEWKWFEFVNIVPNDLEQTRQDWLANWMTLNEFRATRNLPPVKDGDKLRSAYILGAYGAWSDAWNQDQEVVDLDKEFEQPIMKNLELKKKIDWIIEKSIKEKTRWTEEYNQKYRERKMERNNKFDQLYLDKIEKIFEKQQKEILSEYKTRYKENVKEWKSIKIDKKAEMKFPLLSIEKRALIYYQFLKETQNELVKTEAEQALIEVWLVHDFVISDSLEKQLMKNIQKFAWSIDTDTNKKLQNNFEKILSEWLSFDQGKDLLLETFTELKTSRAELIVRTETVRAWNWGSELWRKESGVVEKKQRYTALDERVCEYCWPMNWKIVWLWENYFDKWDVLIWVNGGEMKLDYSATPYPPLHCNCRCVILPVIE